MAGVEDNDNMKPLPRNNSRDEEITSNFEDEVISDGQEVQRSNEEIPSKHEHDFVKDDELKASVILPQYLKNAVRAAVDGIEDSNPFLAEKLDDDSAPTSPILVFFNSKSGGRMGPTLNKLLNNLIGPSQVFDLSMVNPFNVISATLKALQSLSEKGDSVAQASLERMRILVAGGDGTVGWLLSTVAQLDSHVTPPVGVIPLGTGNDLARSFGWGPGFTSPSLSSVKQKLLEAAGAPVAKLDGWHITVVPPAGTDTSALSFPHAMAPLQQEEGSAGPQGFRASFYNYLSLGMDAQIAHGFHHLREEKPWLASGGTANKVIYSSFGCTQGWFCSSCSPQPQRSSVSGVATIFVKKAAMGEWEELYVPFRLRSVIILNLQSYAGGWNLWGTLPQKRNEKEGWAQPRVDDGLLEIVGLFDGWHAMLAIGGLVKAKHLAQVAAVRIELRGSQSKNAFMQLDGEPWQQPLEDPLEPTVVEVSRIEKQSVLLTPAKASALKPGS